MSLEGHSFFHLFTIEFIGGTVGGCLNSVVGKPNSCMINNCRTPIRYCESNIGYRVFLI